MVWICLQASSIHDSIREIKHLSVVFFWVKTSSTDYQGAVLLPKWLAVCLHFYLQTVTIKWLFVWKWSKVYGNVLAVLGSLAICTVYTNKFIFGQLKLRLWLYKLFQVGSCEARDIMAFWSDLSNSGLVLLWSWHFIFCIQYNTIQYNAIQNNKNQNSGISFGWCLKFVISRTACQKCNNHPPHSHNFENFCFRNQCTCNQYQWFILPKHALASIYLLLYKSGLLVVNLWVIIRYSQQFKIQSSFSPLIQYCQQLISV